MFVVKRTIVGVGMALVLTACGGAEVDGPRNAPSKPVRTTSTASPSPLPTKASPTAKPTAPRVAPKVVKTTPAPRRTTSAPRKPSVYYANCSEVRAAGADPIRRGDPGYSRKLDRDGDGVACE